MKKHLFAPFSKRLKVGQTIADMSLVALRKAQDAQGCFVSLQTEDQIIQRCAQVEAQIASGADLPLAGIPFCVKDNIYVKGMVTSSNCPGFGDVATYSAPAVVKAEEAGAILIGKNTMDQFATGLNGTRTPEPLCRNSIDPTMIPGGSSSGSAVAVALDICGFSLGSDTGGSGRVPAAANGIVGFKPTPGSISGRGLVYCNRSFDIIPIFAKTVEDAKAVFDVIGGADSEDPYAYLGDQVEPTNEVDKTFVIPSKLDHFGDLVAEKAHQENLAKLEKSGASFKEIDFEPFAKIGQKVFGSALVAERLVDYGNFIEGNPEKVLEPVAKAINNGRTYSARDLYETLHEIAELKIECMKQLEGTSGLILPTIPRLYKIKEMLANPMELNNVMGTYTYFANPIGFSAIAIPGIQRSDGLPSSICLAAPAGTDLKNLAIAKLIESIFIVD
ncbi:MAG: amidase family protein [Lentilitoribacter sp.]